MCASISGVNALPQVAESKGTYIYNLRDIAKFPSTDTVPFCSPPRNLGLFSCRFAKNVCYQTFWIFSNIRGKKVVSLCCFNFLFFMSEIKTFFSLLNSYVYFLFYELSVQYFTPNPLELLVFSVSISKIFDFFFSWFKPAHLAVCLRQKLHIFFPV